MTETKIEMISRAIDPVAWDDTQWLPTPASVLAMHARRQTAIATAAQVLAALVQEAEVEPTILTLDNHVARIRNEAYPAWINAEARGPAVEYRTSREKAFDAGVRAALSSRREAVDARAWVARQYRD